MSLGENKTFKPWQFPRAAETKDQNRIALNNRN
jgi:hypothetical protein